jgi:hypothetical protein
MDTAGSAVLLATLVAAAAAAVYTTASAEPPTRLSDAAYIAAARCEGLAQGAKLDDSKVKVLMNQQDRGRLSDVLDRADQARADAVHQARRADGYTKQSVSAELDGACQTYLKG